jgi:hypothetical protein
MRFRNPVSDQSRNGTGSKHAAESIDPLPISSKSLIVSGILFVTLFLIALGSVIWAGVAGVFVIGILMLGLYLGITFIAVGIGWIPTSLGITRSVAQKPSGSGLGGTVTPSEKP